MPYILTTNRQRIEVSYEECAKAKVCGNADNRRSEPNSIHCLASTDVGRYTIFTVWLCVVGCWLTSAREKPDNYARRIYGPERYDKWDDLDGAMLSHNSIASHYKSLDNLENNA